MKKVIMKSYHKITITETGRDTLKDEPKIFNEFSLTFGSLDEIKEYIIDKYGKIPKSKVYVDDKNGISRQVGYHYSFWNKDVSHGSKSWYQTDWIEITEVTEVPVLL